MTQRPSNLPARPNRAADDALSEILRAVRFTRALYYTVSAAKPWPAIRVPVGHALAAGLGTRTRNVLSYHVITEGSCWTGLEDGEPTSLARGDVVVYPRGDAYFLAPAPGRPDGDADAARMVELLQGVSSGVVPPRFAFGAPDAEHVGFVCGFLGCDPRPFDPLLAALPRMLVVRGGDRLTHLVELALADIDGAPGQDSVRERLSESMFIETVRQHLATLAPDQVGWLAGLRDAMVGRALALLHQRPDRSWTLVSLAKETGASRSALADRFTKLVGKPPMQYLTRWRMQIAAHLLGNSDAKVSDVAIQVGYDSEAAFSRAFKKACGVPPAQWREARSREPS